MIDNLGQRAVACADWKWLPGMAFLMSMEPNGVCNRRRMQHSYMMIGCRI